MAYAYITLAAARSQLAERLEDPNLVFWSQAELNFYIIEAIRCWQSLTGAYKQSASFSTVNGTAFYDLTTVTLSPVNAFSYNATASDLVSLICYHLLEPQFSSGVSVGIQYTLANVVTAVQNRINRFLGDTGTVITRITQSASAPTNPITSLPDSVIDVRRAAWNNGSGSITALWRDDEFSFNAFVPGRLGSPSDPPLAYGQFTLPPVSIEVAPSPLNAGTLDLCVVQSGPVLPTNAGTFYGSTFLLGVPDDLSWAVKWGALSDLLSLDGQNPDPARASYCEQRYQAAVELSKMYPSVLTATLGNTSLACVAVFDLDAYKSSWQSATHASPEMLGFAGRNLLALSPVPNAVYSVSANLVSNIPVPAGDGDNLQVGREVVDTILDYAQHLAMFKVGGSEFESTAKLYSNLVAMAALQNSRLSKMALYRTMLEQPATRQLQEVPRV